MKCFNCHTELTQKKSMFGYYYSCPHCGKTFETSGQKFYNSKKYDNRFDFDKKKNR